MDSVGQRKIVRRESTALEVFGTCPRTPEPSGLHVMSLRNQSCEERIILSVTACCCCLYGRRSARSQSTDAAKGISALYIGEFGLKSIGGGMLAA